MQEPEQGPVQEPAEDQIIEGYLKVSVMSDPLSMAELSSLIEPLENLTVASVWGSMAAEESRAKQVSEVRSIMLEAKARSKAGSRFYPGFDLERQPGLKELFDPNDRDDAGFDPFDPLDAGVITGVNSWLRRIVHQAHPDLYHDVFSFADVRKLKHHSPLIVELVVILGAAAVLGPPLLAYGCMKAVAAGRRAFAETAIRETEVELKQEELKQRRLQTLILENIQEGVSEAADRGELPIPSDVLTSTANTASTAIADLSTSPLIGEVTVGLSLK